MARLDEIRLMVKIARLYYDQGLRQVEIMERLNIHQSTVSRLLKKARETNVVRISVATPTGVHADLEEALETRFALKEAVVVDSDQIEEHIIRDLGAAAGFYLDTTIKPGLIIGISSWSRALLAMVEMMDQSSIGKGGQVVQILGGFGSSETQSYATYLTQRLASNIGASPVLLQAPGIVGSAEVQQILSSDRTVREASDLFDRVDVALVGIGSLEPSRFLTRSGNVFSPEERMQLAGQGAVGDICLRFFDQAGKTIESPLMQRVIGMNLDQLKRVQRIVGIAGGTGKLEAIRAALTGRLINILITDRDTAQSLLAAEAAQIGAPFGEPTPLSKSGKPSRSSAPGKEERLA
ncbi:MAG TPA: sugar-binding transcriptional regulator [Acidobacteriaceae bacterium]|nr:sugar-binding transcriptional regulator [Acidobacteriaceae bacterium]